MNKLEQKRYLFDRYLSEDANFPREAKLAAKLIKDNGMDVWRYVSFGFTLYTLNIFNKPFGKQALEKGHKNLKLAESKKKDVDIQKELVYKPEEKTTADTNKSLKDRLLN